MQLLNLYIALLASAFLTLTHASGWWMDQPYGSPENFNMEVEYEQNITLECADSRSEGRSTEFMYWIRPDLTVMKDDSEEYFKTLDGPAGWKVQNNKMTLQFVQESHFGFYYCRLFEAIANEEIYVKIGVNYPGPYFGDLWEKYELNVIIGFSAAGGFLLACGIIYVVQHFFWDGSTSPSIGVDEFEVKDSDASGNIFHENGKKGEHGIIDMEKVNGIDGVDNPVYDQPTSHEDRGNEMDTQF